jgi:branched-chain amino acid transport system ATP-binding protein
MLKLNQVHTYYGNSHILQGISFDIPPSKCIALLGRNGAGKTTTIHTIAGITPPRRGSIQYEEETISHLPTHQISKRGIGLVPQGRRIFPSLTIKENLTMPARKPRAIGDSMTEWTLEKVYEFFPILKEREMNR